MMKIEIDFNLFNIFLTKIILILKSFFFSNLKAAYRL